MQHLMVRLQTTWQLSSRLLKAAGPLPAPAVATARWLSSDSTTSSCRSNEQHADDQKEAQEEHSGHALSTSHGAQQQQASRQRPPSSSQTRYDSGNSYQSPMQQGGFKALRYALKQKFVHYWHLDPTLDALLKQLHHVRDAAQLLRFLNAHAKHSQATAAGQTAQRCAAPQQQQQLQQAEDAAQGNAAATAALHPKVLGLASQKAETLLHVGVSEAVKQGGSGAAMTNAGRILGMIAVQLQQQLASHAATLDSAQAGGAADAQRIASPPALTLDSHKHLLDAVLKFANASCKLQQTPPLGLLSAVAAYVSSLAPPPNLNIAALAETSGNTGGQDCRESLWLELPKVLLAMCRMPGLWSGPQQPGYSMAAQQAVAYALEATMPLMSLPQLASVAVQVLQAVPFTLQAASDASSLAAPVQRVSQALAAQAEALSAQAGLMQRPTAAACATYVRGSVEASEGGGVDPRTLQGWTQLHNDDVGTAFWSEQVLAALPAAAMSAAESAAGDCRGHLSESESAAEPTVEVFGKLLSRAVEGMQSAGALNFTQVASLLAVAEACPDVVLPLVPAMAKLAQPRQRVRSLLLGDMPGAAVVEGALCCRMLLGAAALYDRCGVHVVKVRHLLPC